MAKAGTICGYHSFVFDAVIRLQLNYIVLK